MNQIVKKIDIHVHTSESDWPTFPQTTGYPLPEELIAVYDKMGIEKGVLLPPCMNYSFVPVSNYETYKIVEKYPDRFAWFCIFDPRQVKNSENTDFVPALQWCKDHGAKGVGELAANIPFDDPRALNLFRCCEEADMPVLFHVGLKGIEYGLIGGEHLEKLETALKMFPKLRFFGHSTRFWWEISKYDVQDPEYKFCEGKVNPGGAVVELMRKYPNLMCDLSAGSGTSAMTRDPEFTYAFMEEFADRLFYGTDICRKTALQDPPVRLSEFLDNAMLEGKISYETYYKICRGNAEKLLGMV